MSEAAPLRIILLTDVFPPGSGGSGWSTYYLGKALAEAGHSVLAMRPVYGTGCTRPGLRANAYGGLAVEEILTPNPPHWAARAGMGRAWSQRVAVRLMSRRAASLARRGRGRVDVLHGQHRVSGVAASVAAGKARGNGARVVALCTVRDYWPLCPSSARLFTGTQGQPLECPDCHRFLSYMRCVAGAGKSAALALAPLRWGDTLLACRELVGCDAIIAVSGYVRNELARSGRLPDAKLRTIPNLVDLPSVDRATRGEWPLHDLSPGDRFMLFAGKLDVNKGAWLLPRAVERSGMRLPLVVAGDGPLRDNIGREAAVRGLDFRFYDWLDNDAVIRLMGSARALLFPSAWQEPLSRVLLEGCAAGAAIVALDSGGTGDAIRPMESGWLASDLAGFSEGIRAVATQGGLNAKLRQGARAMAEHKFAAPVVAAQVVALYRELLEGVGGVV